jgi:hypothetical protein
VYLLVLNNVNSRLLLVHNVKKVESRERLALNLSRISIYFETLRTHTTQKNIYSCGLNVLLDRSGHSTVEIICFFIMSC